MIVSKLAVFHIALQDFKSAAIFAGNGYLLTALLITILTETFFIVTHPACGLLRIARGLGVSLFSGVIGFGISHVIQLQKDRLNTARLLLHGYRHQNQEVQRTFNERIWRNTYLLGRPNTPLVSQTWVITIDRNSLLKDPESVLTTIALDMNETIPNPTELSVTFKDEAGLDRGGLSRELLSELLKWLAINACSSTSALYSFESEKDGVLASISASSPEAKYYFLEEEDLVTLGEVELTQLLELAYPDSIPQHFYINGRANVEAIKNEYAAIKRSPH